MAETDHDAVVAMYDEADRELLRVIEDSKTPGVSRAEILQFNREIVLLQDGMQYSYRAGDRAKLSLLVSNFSPEVLDGAELSWNVQMSGKAIKEGRVGEQVPGEDHLQLREICFHIP